MTNGPIIFLILLLSFTIASGRPVVSPSTGRLYSAVQSGNIENARIALQNANVNVQEAGTTALHIAVRAKNSEMVRFLLDQGASHELRDQYNTVPLHLTSKTNDVESARLLIDAGTPVDVKGFTSNDGSAMSTTLILAAELGSLELVQFLVERGANINYVNNFERTALFWARKSGRRRVADYLVKQGATDDIQEAMRLSALFEQEKQKKEEERAQAAKKALAEAKDQAKKEAEQAAAAKAEAKKLLSQAVILRKEGKHKEAQKSLVQVLRQDANNLKARVHLCLCYIALGKRKAAVKQYKIVKKHNPKLAKRLRRKLKRKK